MKTLPTQIRWLIRRDMDEVIDIEKRSFDYPWTEEEFLCCLRQRNCIGTVLEDDMLIKGFMIYELHPRCLRIINLAVDPIHRRSTFGTQMVQRLKDKLEQQKRNMLEVEIRESNLAAQLFFKSCGFTFIKFLRRQFDNGEDAYLFRYRLRGA